MWHIWIMGELVRALIGTIVVALTFWATPAGSQQVDAAHFAARAVAQSAELSPTGRFAAYIRRVADGEEIVVVDLASQEARAVQAISRETGSFNWLEWKSDNRLVLSVSARIRAEIYGVSARFPVHRIVVLNRDGSELIPMFEGQMRNLGRGLGSNFLIDVLAEDPNHVLLAAWDNLGTGVWRANVWTGRAERIDDGGQDTLRYVTDGQGYPVIRVDELPNRSGFRFLRRAHGVGRWTLALEARRSALMTNSPDFQIVASGPGTGEVYVLARPPERDLLALYLYNTATGELSAPLQTPAVADATAPWLNPLTKELVATCELGQRLICGARDRNDQRHLAAIDAYFGGRATVVLSDMSAEGSTWLLHVEGPMEPNAYYVYDRTARRLTLLAELYPDIERNLLSNTDVVAYRARDGLELWAYVTARAGTGPRPTVVLPHGGPEARDYPGYDAFVQFLASRGYVVLQPNFRGSEGFGRSFADAGRGQWGLRMQDDVSDAVGHMIRAGIADPQRICIVGMSYGGYAALAGAVLTPDLYRCAISIAGVSDLREMLRDERSEGRRGSIDYQYWVRSIGDPNANRSAIIEASPARQAANVRIPVLLMHGEADSVVEIAQSEIMERAMLEAGGAVRLIRFANAGHSWNSWEDEQRLTLLRETEAFLSRHLSPGTMTPVAAANPGGR